MYLGKEIQTDVFPSRSSIQHTLSTYFLPIVSFMTKISLLVLFFWSFEHRPMARKPFWDSVMHEQSIRARHSDTGVVDDPIVFVSYAWLRRFTIHLLLENRFSQSKRDLSPTQHHPSQTNYLNSVAFWQSTWEDFSSLSRSVNDERWDGWFASFGSWWWRWLLLLFSDLKFWRIEERQKRWCHPSHVYRNSLAPM